MRARLGIVRAHVWDGQESADEFLALARDHAELLGLPDDLGVANDLESAWQFWQSVRVLRAARAAFPDSLRVTDRLAEARAGAISVFAWRREPRGCCYPN